MKAITVEPKKPGTTKLVDIEKPENFMNALHRKPNDIKVVNSVSET